MILLPENLRHARKVQSGKFIVEAFVHLPVHRSDFHSELGWGILLLRHPPFACSAESRKIVKLILDYSRSRLLGHSVWVNAVSENFL